MTARCGMLIDGRWVGATGRSVIEVIDPATEDVVGTVPVATRADLDAALDAAHERGNNGATLTSGHAAGS